MCGIVAPMAMQRAAKSLYHRGPDGQRQWISPNSRVGLGHVRLSIINLATGDKLIHTEDERAHITASTIRDFSILGAPKGATLDDGNPFFAQPNQDQFSRLRAIFWIRRMTATISDVVFNKLSATR